jgi:hypothetical protein
LHGNLQLRIRVSLTRNEKHNRRQHRNQRGSDAVFLFTKNDLVQTKSQTLFCYKATIIPLSFKHRNPSLLERISLWRLRIHTFYLGEIPQTMKNPVFIRFAYQNKNCTIKTEYRSPNMRDKIRKLKDELQTLLNKKTR